MRKFFKILSYVVSIYILLVVSLFLLTSQSKCNILSSGSCSNLDMAYMMVLVPIVLPWSFLEEYIENSKAQEEDRIRLERNQGVLSGNRKALENCMKTCYSLWNTDEEKELFDIASKKLIALDDGSQELTPKQANALMIAYSHTQDDLDIHDIKKQEYIMRGWELMKTVNHYDFKDHFLYHIGSQIILANYNLMTLDNKKAYSVFENCMTDQTWQKANFELRTEATYYLCIDNLSNYQHNTQQTEQQFGQNLIPKWKNELNTAEK